jgi:outer membrane biogenesis lipoprotein LolB
MRFADKSITARGSLIAIILITLASGCAHLKRTGVSDPEILWNKAITFKTSDSQFSAQGKITYDSPKLTQTVNFVWRQEGNKNLRIDVSGFLGIGLASACISGDMAWLNIPLKSLYLSGTLSGLDSMASETAGLDVIRLLNVIKGQPPIESGKYSVAQDAEKFYLYVFARKDTTITYRLDSDNSRIIGYRRDIGEKEEYGISYGDWKQFNGFNLPHRVEISYPREGSSLTIKFSSMAIEQAFDKEIWQQPKVGAGNGR